jgi:hypothetical protein
MNHIAAFRRSQEVAMDTLIGYALNQSNLSSSFQKGIVKECSCSIQNIETAMRQLDCLLIHIGFFCSLRAHVNHLLKNGFARINFANVSKPSIFWLFSSLSYKHAINFYIVISPVVNFVLTAVGISDVSFKRKVRSAIDIIVLRKSSSLFNCREWREIILFVNDVRIDLNSFDRGY